MSRPDAKYRLTDVEKQSVIAEMRMILIACAQQRQTITYGELALRIQSCAVHPHSIVFAHLLREACRQAEAAGEGLLCALVVTRTTGMPGGGYFRRDDLPPDLDASDLEAFWRSELEQVFVHWSEPRR